MDSGATNHVYCSLQGFKETRRLEASGFSFSWGNGAVVLAAAVGELVLNFAHNKTIILRDVYYVPDFGKNLISVSKLIFDGFRLEFENDGIKILRNNSIICKALLFDNLFYLKPIIPTVLNTKTKHLTIEIRDSKWIETISHTNGTYV